MKSRREVPTRMGGTVRGSCMIHTYLPICNNTSVQCPVVVLSCFRGSAIALAITYFLVLIQLVAYIWGSGVYVETWDGTTAHGYGV